MKAIMAAIDSGDDDNACAELERIGGSPELVLEQLVVEGDFDVKVWALDTAIRVLPRSDAARVVARLADDANPDIRDIAFQRLLELDPRELQRDNAKLRTKLRSKDFYEPVTALWAVAELKDTSYKPLVSEIAMRPAVEFHARIAEIVQLVLDGRDRTIAERMIAHDHDAMHWLARAAAILNTPISRASLERVANSEFDDECRDICATKLRGLATTPQ